QIVVLDVRVVRMKRGVVLVVRFRRIKRLQRDHLGHDRMREDFGLVQLRDVGLRNPLLLIAAVEDHGAILRPLVRALAIQLRRIVRNGEKHLKQLPIGDLRWIVNDLDRLRVPGSSGANYFVFRGDGRPSRVSGGGADDALHMLENRLHAPETSAGKNGGLLAAFANMAAKSNKEESNRLKRDFDITILPSDFAPRLFYWLESQLQRKLHTIRSCDWGGSQDCTATQRATRCLTPRFLICHHERPLGREGSAVPSTSFRPQTTADSSLRS